MSKFIKLLNIAFMLLMLASVKNAMANNFLFEVNVSGDKTKPALILIPGLMSDASVYEELANKFSLNYYVHAISVKGFAGTTQDAAFSLEQLIQDIGTYIAQKNLVKATIIGHSMGGLTAFSVASKYPSKISKVVSIDGLPFIGPIFTRTNNTSAAMLAPQATAMKNMYQNMSSEQIAAQTQQSVFIQATSQANQAHIVDMAKKSDPNTVANAMFDVMSTDLRDELSLITIPMLMLGASGAFTQDTQHEQVETLYKEQFVNAKDAQIIMNREVRHFMMLDDIDWVYNTVTSFLGE